jgi:hypothetical protein
MFKDKAKKKEQVCLTPASADLFLDLFFGRENVGDIFLRNVRFFSNSTALQPSHRHENLRSKFIVPSRLSNQGGLVKQGT